MRRWRRSDSAMRRWRRSDSAMRRSDSAKRRRSDSTMRRSDSAMRRWRTDRQTDRQIYLFDQIEKIQRIDI